MLKLLDSSLRLCVVPLSVASIWMTVTNEQDNSDYGVLKYSSLSGLKYMVCVSAICAIYALLAAVFSWVVNRTVSKSWIFFLSDQIIAYVMVTSVAAAMEIYYLAYNGDKEVSWSQACESYGRFCSKVKLALIFHFLALCCFLVLAVISDYRAFSLFEPPCANFKAEEQLRT
ncbi:CASP-like protein 2D1 [Prosopis cineraria]|uniref:CASP-like protein 2D1 n=1 Tax=Prosopis cineraria TaxID=364024 RepID=UPI00240FE011|nr:CASP-like protein 2D1 [Prosopis cineraria]